LVLIKDKNLKAIRNNEKTPQLSNIEKVKFFLSFLQKSKSEVRKMWENLWILICNTFAAR
jgi:hypothetical protein